MGIEDETAPAGLHTLTALPPAPVGREASAYCAPGRTVFGTRAGAPAGGWVRALQGGRQAALVAAVWTAAFVGGLTVAVATVPEPDAGTVADPPVTSLVGAGTRTTGDPPPTVGAPATTVTTAVAPATPAATHVTEPATSEDGGPSGRGKGNGEGPPGQAGKGHGRD